MKLDGEIKRALALLTRDEVLVKFKLLGAKPPVMIPVEILSLRSSQFELTKLKCSKLMMVKQYEPAIKKEPSNICKDTTGTLQHFLNCKQQTLWDLECRSIQDSETRMGANKGVCGGPHT